MRYEEFKLSQVLVAVLLYFILAFTVLSQEKIIQQEAITFEKCLKVITTSENKLSVAPVLTDVSEKKRVAVFKLIDGTLTITCDGLEQKVTVSTNVN